MNDKQINTAELRRLAEAAEKFRYIYEAARNIDHPSYPGSDECEAWEDALEAYQEAASPAAIIELLDMVEGMKCCTNCKHIKESCDNCCDFSDWEMWGG